MNGAAFFQVWKVSVAARRRDGTQRQTLKLKRINGIHYSHACSLPTSNKNEGRWCDEASELEVRVMDVVLKL